MLMFNTTRPVLLGRLAVYAPDRETAMKVYADVVHKTQSRAFGTVTLDSGEEIDWVDMARGVAPPHEQQ